MTRPEKIALVTGATGFVGQHLTRRLLREPNTRVRLLARHRPRAEEAFAPLDGRLEIVQGDLTDPRSLEGLCEGVSVVYHCAIAVLGTFHSGQGDDDFDAINHRGTHNLALEALKSKVERFVFTSSTAAMGTPEESVVDENTPCRPQNPYQRSKRAAEERLLELHRHRGLDLVIIRPCLVTGPGKKGGELLKLFRMCKRGHFPIIGRRFEVEKPLIDVSDLVNALILGAHKGRSGQIYLVHSDAGHTLGQIVRTAGRVVGNPRPSINIPLPIAWLGSRLTTPLFDLLHRPPPLSPNRLRLFISSRRIDIRKARRELGYTPEQQSLFEMLGPTFDYYVATGQF